MGARHRPLRTLLLTAAWLAAPHAGAEGMEVDGFLQFHVVARTGAADCPAGTACDFPWAELRGQLKLEGQGEGTAFLGRFDLLQDLALESAALQVRELHGDLTGEAFSLRAGRQVITWGVGDLLFINDTFPKDWVAMFTGQPMQNLKQGSDAVKLDLFPDPVTLELVAARFRPDVLPDDRRFVYADPLAGLSRETTEPVEHLDDLELSIKVSGYLDNWELAGYASRTHYHGPAWRVTGSEAHGSYPRLNTLGASLTGPAAGGVISLEAGYYDSPEDRAGRDASVENSQLRGLLGYSRQLWEDGTLGLQLYGERMQDHDAYLATLPTGFPARERLRTVQTLRFTQLFANQTVTMNVFAFLGLSEGDRYIIPSLRYALTDNLWAEVGANWFDGDRNGTFGSLAENSNVYATLRYAF